MEELKQALSVHKCLNIRIDLTKDLPLTILGKNVDIAKKKRKVSLDEIVLEEDLPPLAELINDISNGFSETLSTHCRMNIGDEYHWFYICCDRAKDKFAKMPYLIGTMLDVSEYLENAGDDPVISAFRDKNDRKINLENSQDNLLMEVLDRDYLIKIQIPFRQINGVYSAIFDDKGSLLCTPNPADTTFDAGAYKFRKQKEIRINHQTAGYWMITSQKSELLEKYAQLLDVLAATVSKLANAFVVLFNEMENSRNANKMLGENVEQQILLNSIYAIILENKNSRKALSAVLKLIGEYLKLDRVVLYVPDGDNQVVYHSEWAVSEEFYLGMSTRSKADYSKLSEAFEYCDTYFSIGTDHDLGEHGVPSFVASRLTEKGKETGFIFYQQIKQERIWTPLEKKMLRSASQIISTMLIRCNMDAQLREKNDQLRHLAFYDSALDIPNRAMLDKDLDASLDRGEKGAAIAVKVTNMRIINEMFGHGYTDSLLKTVAQYITEMPVQGLRVYRFTGNIMMVILTGNDGEKAKQFAEALLFRFRKPWSYAGREHFLEAGAGISLYPVNGTRCEEIYRASTLSMYRAIEFGKNSYAFYAREFERSSEETYQIEQKLRRAIESGMKGFYLNYQPVLEKNREIRSFEAFVHWNDPVEGELSPSQLMGIAENLGFDIAIDNWVMTQACEFCRHCRDLTGRDLSVSVNVTAREIQTNTVGQMIEAALKRSGLTAANLIVEVPEKALLNFSGDSYSIIGRLKRQGVTIAIDSFGKEYTSLATLKNSFVDIIKMGQSIFTNTNDEFDRTMVASVVTLAHCADVKVCVKKIENVRQLDICDGYGIDMRQGMYYSPPLSEQEMLELLGETHVRIATSE